MDMAPAELTRIGCVRNDHRRLCDRPPALRPAPLDRHSTTIPRNRRGRIEALRRQWPPRSGIGSGRSASAVPCAFAKRWRAARSASQSCALIGLSTYILNKRSKT